MNYDGARSMLDEWVADYGVQASPAALRYLAGRLDRVTDDVCERAVELAVEKARGHKTGDEAAVAISAIRPSDCEPRDDDW